MASNDPPNGPGPGPGGPGSQHGTRAGVSVDLNQPIKIVDVNFQGVKRTRPTLLAKMVSDIFASTSLFDCVLKAHQIKERMNSLNAFSSVEVQLEPRDEANNSIEHIATFVVEEKGFCRLSAQTAVDNQSTHLNMEISTPNITGSGDSISLSSKFNGRLYSGECRYRIPITPWRSLWNPTYSLFYSQYQYDHQPSGFDQDDRSIVNQVDFFSMPHLEHSISFENVWRHIKSTSNTTPIEIREQSGHSVKSSLKHTVTWDNRNTYNFPTEGALARLTNEFTTNLISGGARFTRHEGNLQLNALILPQYDLLCQLNILAGSLIRPNKISICDRFFAGGPLTLRGFKFQGLEPNIRGHPLGDMSYLSAGIHLYSILPYTTPETPINDYIRPHIFINTGTIGDMNEIWRISSRHDIKREALRFRDSLRYSCGIGLVMYFLRMRLEVNYCIPLVSRQNDLCSRGLQWGFGLTYS